MVRIVSCVAVVLLLTSSGGQSAPVKGARTKPGVRIAAKSHMEFEEMFQGGRRACVIAVGDHDPPVVMEIAVYNAANERVADDQGIDFVAAIWYPPRDGPYKVVVKNTGMAYNDIYLVFK